MNSKKLKIALVGCGQIADAHLQEIRKIAYAEAVAVCDRHPELAQQAAARFGVPGVFSDLTQMLEVARPDVLHIATPPATHAAIAREALAAGAHIYVEKPFTVDAAEAESVLAAAAAGGRLACVGHDQLYDPVWERCRALVRRGDLGRVVHVDAFTGYDLGGPFGKLFATEPGHWIHQLPGGLFHNTVSHALYRITDFLPDERPRVWATWFAGGPAAGGPTELRVLLQGDAVTGSLLFSSTARPLHRIARLYGTREAVEVDLDGQLLRRTRAASLPGALGKIELPFRHLREAAAALGRNCWRFLRSDLHYFAGMRRLFEGFYGAVRGGGEPPIPYAEILRVTALMDRIFESCREGQAAGRGEGPGGGSATTARPQGRVQTIRNAASGGHS